MHTGRTFIGFLSSWATASNEFFFNIILKQIALLHTTLELLGLRLLADRMVALEYIDELSYQTVRRVLKKTNLSLG